MELIQNSINLTMEQFRDILNKLENSSVTIRKTLENKYNIVINGEEFLDIDKFTLSKLLDFYRIKSSYFAENDDTIIKMPKSYYKNREIMELLKDISVLNFFIDCCDMEGFFEERELKYAKINDIMIRQLESAKTVYFSHPMKTNNSEYEFVCLELLYNMFPNCEIINPNSDKYRWSKGWDVHSEELDGVWDNKFWYYLYDSMVHYCNLIKNSDVLCYAPIFEINSRRLPKDHTRRVNYIRHVTKGVKTEVSYATKLGIPVLTFDQPVNGSSSSSSSSSGGLTNDIIDKYNGLIPSKIPNPLFMCDMKIKGGNKSSSFSETLRDVGNIYRYNSPYPFDLYYHKLTLEIAEKPKHMEEYKLFEPWDIESPILDIQKMKLKEFGMKKEEIDGIKTFLNARERIDEMLSSKPLPGSELKVKAKYICDFVEYMKMIGIDCIDCISCADVNNMLSVDLINFKLDKLESKLRPASCIFMIDRNNYEKVKDLFRKYGFTKKFVDLTDRLKIIENEYEGPIKKFRSHVSLENIYLRKISNDVAIGYEGHEKSKLLEDMRKVENIREMKD